MNSMKPYIRFYTPECTQQIPNLPQRFEIDPHLITSVCVCKILLPRFNETETTAQ